MGSNTKKTPTLSCKQSHHKASILMMSIILSILMSDLLKLLNHSSLSNANFGICLSRLDWPKKITHCLRADAVWDIQMLSTQMYLRDGTNDILKLQADCVP